MRRPDPSPLRGRQRNRLRSGCGRRRAAFAGADFEHRTKVIRQILVRADFGEALFKHLLVPVEIFASVIIHFGQLVANRVSAMLPAVAGQRLADMPGKHALVALDEERSFVDAGAKVVLLVAKPLRIQRQFGELGDVEGHCQKRGASPGGIGRSADVRMNSRHPDLPQVTVGADVAAGGAAGRHAGERLRLEIGPVLVDRQNMDTVLAACGQACVLEPDRVEQRQPLDSAHDRVEQTDELDLDADQVDIAPQARPSARPVPGVKDDRQVSDVAGAQQTELRDQPGQSPDRHGPSREAEQIDSVGLVVAGGGEIEIRADVGILIDDLGFDRISGHQIKDAAIVRLRRDAGGIEHYLGRPVGRAVLEL